MEVSAMVVAPKLEAKGNQNLKAFKPWFDKTFQLEVAPECKKNFEDKNGKDSKITDIASLFLPLIKYLRLIGFCPVSIYRDPVTGFFRYKFKWRSWITIYNLLISLSFFAYSVYMLTFLMWFCFTHEFHDVLEVQGLTIDRESDLKRRSPVTEFGTRLVPSTFPLFSICCALGNFYSMPGFIKFLNLWPKFQQEYLRTFPHRTDDPFGTFKKFRNVFSTFFVIIGICAVSFVTIILKFCHSWKICLFSETILSTVCGSLTILILLGIHASNILIFRCLKEAFRQIRVGIRMWYKNVRPSLREDLSNNLFMNAKHWTKIVVDAKKQVEITSKAWSFHTVSAIFINFIYLCLGIFSCMQGTTEGNRGQVLLVFCSWGFSILMVKAFLCEEITNQEKLIVAQLRQIECDDYIPALIQINNLIDLIVREPAEIKVWSAHTLNKSFLVKLIGQVATYLIVLIQFDNMSA